MKTTGAAFCRSGSFLHTLNANAAQSKKAALKPAAVCGKLIVTGVFTQIKL